MMGPSQAWEPGRRMGFERGTLSPGEKFKSLEDLDSWVLKKQKGLGRVQNNAPGLVSGEGGYRSVPEEGAQEEGRFLKMVCLVSEVLQPGRPNFFPSQRNFQGEPAYPHEGRKEQSMW